MTNIMSYNGGLVVAMAGQDCVTIGSDLRLGSRHLTILMDKPKVYQVGPKLFYGVPGLATDAQTIADRMHFRVKSYELREMRNVSPKVFTRMLSNLLYSHRFGTYFCSPVVAGLNYRQNDQPYVATMDLIGCINEPEDFVASGTGEMQLYGNCENFWEKNMDQDALFEATSQALLSALERDAASGWGVVIYTITPKEVTVKSLKARLD